MGSCTNADKFFPPKRALALPPNALKGKVALVTGGGTGLGKGMALCFASLGAQVAIASRKLDILVETANEIQRKTGSKVIPVEMNIREPESVSRAVDTVEQQLGLPSVVVNNAAGNFISPTERLSPNAFRTIVDTVLMGTAYVTLEMGKRLIRNKQGCSFLAITTPYARTGSPFVVPSAVSKAGVENLTKSLSAEWGKYGMRFNAIAPGPIKTEGAFSRLDPSGEFSQTRAEIPLGRTGEVEELANLAAFMVSDFADWMSGAVVDFDGAQHHLSSGLMSQLHKVTSEQWDQLEQMIRKSNEASKSKSAERSAKL